MTKMNIQNGGKKMKEVRFVHRREVIKTIFFSFVVTLPVFNILFSIFSKKNGMVIPSSSELFKNHKLAG
jgi:hypothetical protein